MFKQTQPESSALTPPQDVAADTEIEAEISVPTDGGGFQTSTAPSTGFSFAATGGGLFGQPAASAGVCNRYSERCGGRFVCLPCALSTLFLWRLGWDLFVLPYEKRSHNWTALYKPPEKQLCFSSNNLLLFLCSPCVCSGLDALKIRTLCERRKPASDGINWKWIVSPIR